MVGKEGRQKEEKGERRKRSLWFKQVRVGRRGGRRKERGEREREGGSSSRFFNS